jgi:hypothetical protein
VDRGIAPTESDLGERAAKGQERALERLVDWVRATGLAPAAILFLEMGKPLSLVASQALFLVQPVLGYVGPMFGLFEDPERIAEYAALLEDSANVDRMVAALQDGWT